MRICVVSYHTSPLDPAGAGMSGGMNVFIANLYKKLARRFQVDIYVRGDGPPVQLVSHVSIRYINHEDVSQFAEAILYQHARNPYHLIHTHYWLSGLIGLYLKTRLGLPWIHTFHTVERLKGISCHKARIEAENEIASKCDVILSPTMVEADTLHRLFPGTRASVIPHGVDTNTFKPTPNGHNSVVFVGRIEPIKGLELLIDASRRIPADFQLKIVGGPSKDRMEYNRLRSYAADQHIFFTGRVGYQQLCHVYADAGMLVMPSYYESFGLAGLEAMASGRPVICFNDTGLAESVNNRAGIIVERKISDLARAIEKLIKDHDLRHELGTAAWKKARGYDWHYIALRYAKFYESIAEN